MNRLHSLFLKLYSAAVVSGEPVADPEFSEEEWTDLFHLAFEQEILSLMYDKCFSYDSFKRVPTESRRLWKDFALSSAIRQITQTNEFLTLILHAQVQGIDPVVIKGVVCRSLYPQPCLRHSVDEDILIPAGETDKYNRFLLSEGLKADDPEVDIDAAAELSYHKANSPSYIELHKTLFDPESDVFGDLNSLFEGVFERTIHMQIEDVNVRTLAPTDHLLYLILHAFKHFVHSGIGIRAVSDIGMFAEHYADEIDWNHIRRSLEQVHAFDFARALLHIVKQYLLPEARFYRYIDWSNDQPDISSDASKSTTNHTDSTSNWHITSIDTAPLLDDILASGVHGNSSLERLHSSNITLNAVSQSRQANPSRKSERSGSLTAIFHSVFLPLDKMSGRFSYLKKAPVLLPVAWLQRIFGYLKENESARRSNISRDTQRASKNSIPQTNTSRSSTSKSNPAESIRLGRSRVELLKLYGIIK